MKQTLTEFKGKTHMSTIIETLISHFKFIKDKTTGEYKQEKKVKIHYKGT